MEGHDDPDRDLPVSLFVSYSWSIDTVPTDLAEWVVYASQDRDAKGIEVARVNGGERSATWTSDENLIYVRVVGRKRSGAEEPWDDVVPDEVFIQGRDESKTPDAPTNVAVGHVDLGLSGRVTVDPPSKGDPASFVQVIQGADAETGKLLSEQKVLPSGLIGADGPPQQVSVAIPMEGYGGTKNVVVRHMGTTGRPSADVARTIKEPDELALFHEVAVCSWSGTTRSNVPAAGATDAHEFDATDGARARAKPTLAGATGGAAGWGTLASGLIASGEFHGAYLRSITVESDEVDLGSTLTFRLTASDTVARKAAAGTSRPIYATQVPLVPAARPDVRLLAEGPAWAARETRMDGKPRQPIRSWRWEYVVGTSTPVAHASSDYKPLPPGGLLSGRYVRVRLVVTDPTGQHRIVCPSATVKALVYRRTPVSTATPEGAVVAPPGSHFVRTDGPPYHYVKATGTGNTGWKASNTGAGALARRSTALAIDNTTTETSIMPTGAYSVPANTLGATGGLKVDITGRIVNNTGSTAGPTIKVKFGGVTVYEGAMSIATSAVTRAFSLHLWIFNLGATNAQEGELDVQIGAPADPTTGYSAPVVANHIDGLGGLASGTADTTSAQTLDITWTWDTADANKTLSIRGGILYVV